VTDPDLSLHERRMFFRVEAAFTDDDFVSERNRSVGRSVALKI
jgi:hypothetical protein